MKVYFYKTLKNPKFYLNHSGLYWYFDLVPSTTSSLLEATFFFSKKEAKECKDYWNTAYNLSDLKLHSISGDLALKIKFKQLQTFIENLESKFNLLTVDNYGDY